MRTTAVLTDGLRRVLIAVLAAAAGLALLAGMTMAYAQQPPDELLPSLVILARSDVPVDALAAGPVGGVLGAPVLVTPRDRLHPAAADALVGLAPDLVVLAGGTAALSEAVEQAVNDLGLPARRAAGSTRHETAVLIAALLAELGAGRPVLTGAPVTDALVPGLNAELLGGMSLQEILDQVEDGAQGPEGPPGPRGAQGRSGPAGEIVLTYAPFGLVSSHSVPVELRHFGNGTRIRGGGVAHLNLTAPLAVAETPYGLASVRYCIADPADGSRIAAVEISDVAETEGGEGIQVARDNTDRDEAGCYTMEVNTRATSYGMLFDQQGEGGVRVTKVQATWLPESQLEST